MSTIQEIVSKLVEEHGREAVMKVLDAIKVTPDATEKAEKTPADKIAECKKNITLWEQKLADGKVKDADKQRDKIEKEKKKLAKLEAKEDSEEEAPKPKKEEKPKKEPKKAAKADSDEEKPKKAESDDKKEKRIKRFSPVMSAQLKTALEAVGLELNDKIKKEFQTYIEELTDDDYRKDGLADHMRAFATMRAPDEEDDEDTPAVPSETSNVGEGGPGSNKKSDTLSLKELQSITVASVEPAGTYWDAENGRFVTGPDADDDEDQNEVKFEKKTYVVGKKTGRVYLVEKPEDDECEAVFAGFIGVGKFKNMKIPKTE